MVKMSEMCKIVQDKLTEEELNSAQKTMKIQELEKELNEIKEENLEYLQAATSLSGQIQILKGKKN
jgi:hypothetical protein